MATIVPVQLAASILSTDLSQLGEQFEKAIKAGILLIHVELMDGLFVFSIRKQLSKILVETAIDTISTHCIY